MIIPGDGDDVAWASYGVPGLTGDRPVVVSVEASVAESSEGAGDSLPLVYWVGISNYTRNEWEWKGPYASSANVPINSDSMRDRYISSVGSLHLTVLVYAKQNSQAPGVNVSSITVTTDSTYYPNKPHYVTIDSIEIGSGGGSGSGRKISTLNPSQYVTVNWTHVPRFSDQDQPNEASLYTVYRQGPVASTSEKVAEIPSPVSTYTDPTDNLVGVGPPIPGLTYKYSVQASNANGFTPLSFPEAGAVPLLPPDNLVATDGAYDNKVVISWDEVTGAEGYEIEYKLDSEGEESWAVLDTVTGGDTLSFEHTESYPVGKECANATIYDYRARATLNMDFSPNYSNVDSGYRAVVNVQNLSATDGDYHDKVVITWDVVTDADGYNLYSKYTDGEIWQLLGCLTGSTSNSFAHTAGNGCAYNVSYDYRCMSTFDGEEALVYSNVDAGYRIVQPPTGVTATDGEYVTKVTVSWTAPATGAAPDSYDIYRCTTETGDYGSPIANTTTTSWDDVTLSDGYTYWYKVTGKSADNHESAFSDPDSGYLAPLDPPTGVAATDGDHADRITVSWTAPATGTVPTGYDVYRATSETGDYGSSPIFSTASISFDDVSAEATNGNTYWYKVMSTRTDWDDSGFSGADSGYVGLSAPENVVATEGDYTDKISVSWTLPGWGPSPDGFNIYRSTSAGGTYTFIGSVVYPASSYDDTTVPDGYSYFYKVRSYKAGYDDSSFSSPAAEGWLTGPSAPENVVASDGGYVAYVRITWTAPSTGPTPDVYQVSRSTSSDGTYSDIGSPTTNLYYEDSSATGDTHYFYKVRSQKSTYHDSEDAGPDEGWRMPLMAPGTLTASTNDTDYVNLSWSAPSSGPLPVDGYNIYRSTVSGELGTYLDSVGSGVVSYQDTPGDYSTYYYTVKATKTDYAEGPGSNQAAGNRSS